MSRRLTSSILGLVVLAGTVCVSGATATNATAAPLAAAAGTPAVAAAAVAPSYQPARNYVMPSGTSFSFPNRTAAERSTIRNRVLFTIQGVWGGPRDRYRLSLSGGKIRIATWSFSDMAVAKALVAAHRRGASVQVIAASQANEGHRAWKYLKRSLGQAYYKPGVPGSTERVSFARECRGACRGAGGTPHSKFFLFDNVGAAHARNVVMQTSMNLTTFAVSGQWNEAQVYHSAELYSYFMRVYREARMNRPLSSTYRNYPSAQVATYFFPFRSATAATDPVMQMLNQTRCTGATAGGSSRTKIRIIQYAIYDNRGLWIAKKLRSLWNAGCDVAIIYSVSTRPILQILRNGSGRGAVPMRQSVITNSEREVVKYNHSKWVTITGNWGRSTASYMTFDGSANWSNAAFGNDEQMQLINNYGVARSHLANFATTWSQGSSHAPGYGSNVVEARLTPSGNSIPWGKGAFKFMSPEG